MNKEKRSILNNDGIQSFIASIICIILGLLLGYIVLLFINPEGAGGFLMPISLIKPPEGGFFIPSRASRP